MTDILYKMRLYFAASIVALPVFKTAVRAQAPVPRSTSGDRYNANPRSDLPSQDTIAGRCGNTPYAAMDPLSCQGHSLPVDSRGACSGARNWMLLKKEGSMCFYCVPIVPPIAGRIVPKSETTAIEREGGWCVEDQADPDCSAICSGGNDNTPKPPDRAVPKQNQKPNLTMQTYKSEATFKIVIKSYIAPIGFNIGRLYHYAPGGQRTIALFAGAADTQFSENPVNDEIDQKYRLYSSRTFRIICNGNLKWASGQVETDVGKELFITPPKLIVPDASNIVANGVLKFSWTGEGRPSPLVEPSFLLVAPRTNTYIWHHIEGQFSCGPLPALRITNFSGSAFPSHRYFVNGTPEDTLQQGPFCKLWDLLPPDATQTALDPANRECRP